MDNVVLDPLAQMEAVVTMKDDVGLGPRIVG